LFEWEETTTTGKQQDDSCFSPNRILDIRSWFPSDHVFGGEYSGSFHIERLAFGGLGAGKNIAR